MTAYLRGRKVLITGIRGATGQYLTEYILGHHENCLCEPSYWNLWYPGATNEQIAHIQPDLIFHLAGKVKVADSFKAPADFIDNNIISTMNLLEAVRRFSPHSKVLVASSCEVYGSPQKFPMDESHPFAPVSPYAASKAAIDLLATMYAKAYGLHIVVSRLFNVINPRAEHLFSSQFARQVAEIEAGKRGTLLYGNLDSARTLLDIRDVVRGYWLLLENGKPGEAYNIGTTVETPLRVFLDILTSKATRTIPRAKSDELLRPVDIRTQVADSSKFIRATGWEPQYSLGESIEFLIQHWRANVAQGA